MQQDFDCLKNVALNKAVFVESIKSLAQRNFRPFTEMSFKLRQTD